MPRLVGGLDTARKVAEAFRPVAEAASKAFKRFGDAFYAMAEKEYRRVNGSPPGSTKTARLRKKRRDHVLRWFTDYISSANAKDVAATDHTPRS